MEPRPGEVEPRSRRAGFEAGAQRGRGKEGLECQLCEEPQSKKRVKSSKLRGGTWGWEGWSTRPGSWESGWRRGRDLHEPANSLGTVGPCACWGSTQVGQHQVVQPACPGEAHQQGASP